MEQISQAPATDPVPAAGTADPAPGDEALREELAKWRERVPKLAAALRQRADESAALKQELERLKSLQGAGQNPGAGIRARDELIAELEGKLADLAKRHKAAQGELHERKLEVDELKADLDTWKGKWQSVTRALDEQAAEVSDRTQRFQGLEEATEDLRRRLAEETAAREASRRALDEVTQERDSLRRRNEQLFETTELANRQIGSLTDSLAELRVSLKHHREREAELTDEHDTLRAQLEARLQVAVEASERAGRVANELNEELHLMSVAAASGVNAGAEADARAAAAERARQEAEQQLFDAKRAQAELRFAVDEQRREVKRLTEVVETAQRTTSEREKERRELSERLQAMEARAEHLELQLAERSALVVTLEQDRADAASARQALEQERDELEAAHMRSERHVKESAEHITQLDAKLERQKELMESLEEELAEAREEQAGAADVRQAEHREAEPEINRLQEQVRKLETLVRERTEALNRLEWQQQLASESSAGESAEVLDPAGNVDGKTLVVLNQQLNDARARNEELLARIRSLETGSGGRRHAGEHGDDLTRIRGVGQKLAEQLNELGIHHYQQIAELDEADLADEKHVLHGHRGRILRDGWIEQAVKLISH